MIGAILAGADDDCISQVEQIAGDVGLAFQIQDDILDITGNIQTLGKPIKSDEKNHKTTYVTIKGLDQAAKEVETISARALERLDALPCRDEFLRELIVSLIHRNN